MSIGDLIEGRNIDRAETGWGVITKNCFWDPPPFVGKRMVDWGVTLGVFLMTWSQEGTIRLSNVVVYVVLELLCWPLRDAFNFRQV